MLSTNPLHLARCSPDASQPCTFRSMWFTDVPFMIPSDSAGNSLAPTLRSTLSIYQFLRRRLFNMILAKVQVILLLRTRNLNLSVLRSTCWSRLRIGMSLRKKTIKSPKAKPTERRMKPELQTLPPEIRMLIFEHLAEGVTMKAVGYSDGGKDAFWFKDRGYLPVVSTCKQFYEEMAQVWFRKASITVKSACPSSFTGDMTAFGTQEFRQRIKHIKIADDDAKRRARICAAFQNAQIECTNRSAAGSRKGAYYFSG